MNLNLRVRPREIAAWRAAAKRADETLSEWVRERLNQQAAVEPKRPARVAK